MATEYVYLIDSKTRFGHEFGRNFIKTSQEIPQEFLDHCQRQRDASMEGRLGTTHSVAEVPTQVADRWKREGFDIMRAPAREIVQRLRSDGLEKFITTRRRV